jgi:hypothetical protein
LSHILSFLIVSDVLFFSFIEQSCKFIGELDCQDATDEHPQSQFEPSCPFQKGMECDEHLCLKNFMVSCGDGQCVMPLSFGESASNIGTAIHGLYVCSSLRNLAFQCEKYSFRPVWTLKEGFCTPIVDSWIAHKTDNIEDWCVFRLKCVLSGGVSTRCPPSITSSMELATICEPLLHYIEYPQKPVMNPFARTVYMLDNLIKKDSSPQYIRVNGRFRCAGFHLIVTNKDLRITLLNSVSVDRDICRQAAKSKSDEFFLHNHSALAPQFNTSCWNDWVSLFNLSTVMDIVTECNEFCLSSHRIHDSVLNCMVKDFDEKPLSQSIQHRRRHCLNCLSSEQQKVCRPVYYLTSSSPFCARGEDIYLTGTHVVLTSLKCDAQDTSECHIFRAHVTKSYIDGENITEATSLPSTVKVIPFAQYCDTYVDTNTGQDEDVEHCLNKWTCANNEYRCLSGQCIPFDWLCDGKLQSSS